MVKMTHCCTAYIGFNNYDASQKKNNDISVENENEPRASGQQPDKLQVNVIMSYQALCIYKHAFYSLLSVLKVPVINIQFNIPGVFTEIFMIIIYCTVSFLIC